MVCVCVSGGGGKGEGEEDEGERIHLSLHSLPLFILSSSPPSSFLFPFSSLCPSLCSFPSSMPADREKMHQLEEEEKALKEENVRLQRRLLRETERREQMSRQLSESESSLEMDDER